MTYFYVFSVPNHDIFRAFFASSHKEMVEMIMWTYFDLRYNQNKIFYTHSINMYGIKWGDEGYKTFLDDCSEYVSRETYDFQSDQFRKKHLIPYNDWNNDNCTSFFDLNQQIYARVYECDGGIYSEYYCENLDKVIEMSRNDFTKDVVIATPRLNQKLKDGKFDSVILGTLKGNSENE